MTDRPELEVMAATLEASGQYRVLRRLTPRSWRNEKPGIETRTALFVDVETTGLDAKTDEIIELAMVPFKYTLEGNIVGVGHGLDRLRQPNRPIPQEIIALTGITPAMVKGQSIDIEEVEQLLMEASLVIAHNAGFDRRFAERLVPAFANKPWACSMTEIDWNTEGFESTKLAYLANANGFFYERHRASHDCAAAVELLSRTLPRAGVPAMKQLLAHARVDSCRIWAENSPFDVKEALKARGYRWNGDDNGKPRSWYVDVPAHKREEELAFLRSQIYKRAVDLKVVTITAFERHSDRV